MALTAAEKKDSFPRRANYLVLQSFTVDFMPVSVAELKRRLRLEDGSDGAAAIVHGEGHGSVDHLEDQVVFAALDGQQNSGNVPRLDLHGDVEIEANSIASGGQQKASFRTKEVARLDLVGARHHASSEVFAPFTNGLVSLPHFFEATNEASDNILKLIVYYYNDVKTRNCLP